MSNEKVRTYICENIKNGKICGQSNFENFAKGRYTMCNECKKEYLRNYRVKNKKIKEVEKMSHNVENFDQKIHDIISDQILNIPLPGIGVSFLEKIQELEDKLKENDTKFTRILSGMGNQLKSLIQEKEHIEESNKKLQIDNENVKRDFEELFEKYNKISNIE